MDDFMDQQGEPGALSEFMLNHPLIGTTLAGVAVSDIPNLAAAAAATKRFGKPAFNDPQVWDDIRAMMRADKTAPMVQELAEEAPLLGRMNRNMYYPDFNSVTLDTSVSKNPYMIAHEYGHSKSIGKDWANKRTKFLAGRMVNKLATPLGVLSAYGLVDDPENRSNVLKATAAISALSSLPTLLEEARASKIGIDMLRARHPGKKWNWMASLLPALATYGVGTGTKVALPLLLDAFANDPASGIPVE